MRRASCALTVGILLLLAPQHARAQSDPDKLFGQATTLITEERFAEAIPLLEEAQRLDPGIGTQFNLAVCYEKVGRLAVAYRNFAQVETLAAAAGKTKREEAAREKVAALRT